MIDDRTPYLDLPLPHPDNLLSEDVGRLRQAVTTLDAGFQEQAATVAASLEQAQNSVNTELTETLSSIQTALSDQQSYVTGQLRKIRLNQLLDLGI